MNHETVLTLPDIPRLDWDRVALIIPRYQDNGSSISQLYYDDGTYDLVKCSCNAILNAFAWHHVTKVDIAKKLTLSCPHYPN